MTNKFVLGLDAKRAFCNRSGLGNYARNIIWALNKYYENIFQVLFTPQVSYDIFNLKDKNLSFKLDTITLVNPLNIPFYKSLWRSYFLGNQLDKYNVSVYHGLSNELPYNIKKANVKKIVTIHDVIFMSHPHLYTKIDANTYFKKTTFALQNADVVISVSEETKNQILKYFKVDPEKIVVVYQPCNRVFNLDYLSEKENSDLLYSTKNKFNLPNNFMLSVGNIEKRKNLINVVKAIDEYNIDYPYVIVGKHTKYADELKSFINQRQIKNVCFLHNVDTLDLKGLYQLADFTIYPSVAEGFGIPIIESLSSKTPPILNDINCFKEAAGDGALFTNTQEIRSLAKSIKKFIDDKELRSEITEKGYNHIQKFSHKQIASKLVDIYLS
ncbi:MAG: glycosyltransferase family 4 protein [Bacteroidales bacterium]